MGITSATPLLAAGIPRPEAVVLTCLGGTRVHLRQGRSVKSDWRLTVACWQRLARQLLIEALYAFSACMMTNVRAIAVRRGDERATGETQFVLLTAKSPSHEHAPSHEHGALGNS